MVHEVILNRLEHELFVLFKELVGNDRELVEVWDTSPILWGVVTMPLECYKGVLDSEILDKLTKTTFCYDYAVTRFGFGGDSETLVLSMDLEKKDN